MIIQSIKLSLIITYLMTLSGCSSSCSSKEDVQAKAEEMVQKFQSLAQSGDMAKLMSLTSKMQSLQNLGDSKDPQAACEAMDDLMDEL